MSELPAPQREVVYPDSDGRPLGETGRHGLAIMDLVAVLRYRFRDRPDDVYVGGNQFHYWVEGDPTQVVCPDVYVVEGRPRDPPRDTWKVWEEDGKVPAFILEATSRSTRVTDLGAKRGLYEQLGVRELALFDPLGEYLRPRLRMWRLVGEGYVEVAAGPYGRWSEVLGLWLEPDAGEPHLVRLREADGAPVLHPEEWAERFEAEAARAEAEAARAEAEAERARRAEAERDQLLAELERLRRR